MCRLAAFAFITLIGLAGAQAQEPGARTAPPPQRSFASPEAAVETLVAAVRAGQGTGRLVGILGAGSATLLSSGDAVADREARARFLAAFDARHEILRPAQGQARLIVGADSWEFPFPIRQEGRNWRFDSRAGAQELVDRRIGRNELDAVQVLRAIVQAQREYAAATPRSQGLPAFARRIMSTPGQRDGLYWESAPGEPESPLGPLLAAASADHRRAPGGAPQPYHGYYFRILEGQGPSAPGGAGEYVLNGRMVGGFGVIAWPARYNSSGIMTFIVNHQGQVFQANLGPNTDALARRIRVYDPGPDWQRVQPD
jgi:hypothetical protein